MEELTMAKLVVAILLLALTMPASAQDRADKILSGCKIMFGILAEKKVPPEGTVMGGGDATFCLGVVQTFVDFCQPTGVPFQNLDIATFSRMLSVVIAYNEASNFGPSSPDSYSTSPLFRHGIYC
jgi:hypothetical protein